MQTPYSPLIYAAVFKLTGGYYLFSAKLVNFAFLCLCRGAALALARRRTRRPLQRRAKLSLFLANYYLLPPPSRRPTTPYPSPSPWRPMPCSCATLTAPSARLLRRRRAAGRGRRGQALLRNPAGALRPGCAALSRRASLRSRIIGGLLPLAGGTVAGAPLLYYAARLGTLRLQQSGLPPAQHEPGASRAVSPP